MLESIPLSWNCSKDYFDILYDMFEAMETEETTISDEKSTFPDGRPSSSSAGDCDYKASSAPAGAKLELGLSLATESRTTSLKAYQCIWISSIFLAINK